MNFTPKTEKQIQEENLIEKGEYSFEVIEAKEKTSKGGNAMMELKLEIFSNESESSRIIFDYLLEKLAYKLRHFCSATGLIKKYEDGTLTADDCVGKSGTCKIVVQENKVGAFPPRNAIADYVVKGESNIVKMSKDDSQSESAQSDASEDIPF